MENLTKKEIDDFREETFLLVYGVKAPKAVFELYKEDLMQVKRLSKTKQETGLLKLVTKYSYAILYCYGHISIRNNRDEYRKEAVKVLGSLKKVSRNFKSGSRVIEVDDREDYGTKLVYDAFDLIKIPTEPKEPKTSKKDLNDSSNTCIAKDEINRLKEELDTKSYKLSKGQKEEDKKIFIKVALVALSTGARLKEITETLELSSKKGVIYFTNEEDTEEGIILELDIKTVRAYLKDIRSHYSERIAKGTDISTGIRKAVKRLNIPNCGNTNNLNTLYRDCLTSSTPK